MADTLYRLFDASDALLYVGIAFNVKVRLAEHRRSKSWWPEVARIELAEYESRRECEAAERRAIVDERPRHNIVGATWTEPLPVRSETIDWDDPYSIVRAYGLNVWLSPNIADDRRARMNALTMVRRLAATGQVA